MIIFSTYKCFGLERKIIFNVDYLFNLFLIALTEHMIFLNRSQISRKLGDHLKKETEPMGYWGTEEHQKPENATSGREFVQAKC